MSTQLTRSPTSRRCLRAGSLLLALCLSTLAARQARAQEGYALKRAGKLQEAAVVLRDVLLEDPSDVILFKTYVSLQRERGALDELQQTLQALLPIAGVRRGAVHNELRKLSTA